MTYISGGQKREKKRTIENAVLTSLAIQRTIFIACHFTMFMVVILVPTTSVDPCVCKWEVINLRTVKF